MSRPAQARDCDQRHGRIRVMSQHEFSTCLPLAKSQYTFGILGFDGPLRPCKMENKGMNEWEVFEMPIQRNLKVWLYTNTETWSCKCGAIVCRLCLCISNLFKSLVYQMDFQSFTK